jgi:hypothetical protein
MPGAADSGAFYGGGDKKSLMEAVADHDDEADGIYAREVRAALYAATGDLATARVQMADASPNALGLGLGPAARQKIWDKARTQADEILKEKQAKFRLPPNPPNRLPAGLSGDTSTTTSGTAASTR